MTGSDVPPTDHGDAGADLEQLVESARRLGVELDEVEALQWLTAVALAHDSDDIRVDMGAGVFGHVVTMLDFSDADLANLRRIGQIVQVPDREGVETALALSGSAAQSRVQTHPGDADFFERVNIHAPTHDDACRLLARVIRDKAGADASGETWQLVEVKFGTHPRDVVVNGVACRQGSPISWTPDQVRAGHLVAHLPPPDGGLAAQTGDPDATDDTVVVRWDEVALDPGWCKLDYVVADPVRRRVAKASNVLDVTWEAPDGTLTPLDGYLDPYFQEVYLEADAVPLFRKVVHALSADALATYVLALQGEVRRYVGGDHPNWGKAAKRMYNIFRMDGSFEQAAYLRELFDEPTAVLYQVGAIVGTLEEASRPGAVLTPRMLLSQLDELVLAVVATLDGDAELAIVRHLLALRAAITDEHDDGSAAAAAARAELATIVNEFFRSRLLALPEIASWLDALQAAAPSSD